MSNELAIKAYQLRSEGKTYLQVANEMGIPEGTIGGLIKAGKKLSEEVSVSELVDTKNETTDSLIESVERAFNTLKESIGSLIEHEVNERVKTERERLTVLCSQTEEKLTALTDANKALETEVLELRAFKKQAQESNLGSFLRKKLRKSA